MTTAATKVLDTVKTAGYGGISNWSIANRTGLSPNTVRRITGELRQAGVISEQGWTRGGNIIGESTIREKLFVATVQQ